mmetsp:Transcript_66547/g.192774  ORF Transcript_66547/g.192774 Transcript_66547/m.192774 type:complete len:204 (-) Transcript_66547:157-768(-)
MARGARNACSGLALGAEVAGGARDAVRGPPWRVRLAASRAGLAFCRGAARRDGPRLASVAHPSGVGTNGVLPKARLATAEGVGQPPARFARHPVELHAGLLRDLTCDGAEHRRHPGHAAGLHIDDVVRRRSVAVAVESADAGDPLEVRGLNLFQELLPGHFRERVVLIQQGVGREQYRVGGVEEEGLVDGQRFRGREVGIGQG